MSEKKPKPKPKPKKNPNVAASAPGPSPAPAGNASDSLRVEGRAAKAVDRYSRERDRIEKLTQIIVREVREFLREAGIPAMVPSRTKDPDSLKEKLLGKSFREALETINEAPELTSHIKDLGGVRILLYEEKDSVDVLDLIATTFSVVAGKQFDDRDTVEKRTDNEFVKSKGYRSFHRVAQLTPEAIADDPSITNLKNVSCEIQVTFLPDHIWNEAEHDIEYKTPDGQPSTAQELHLETLRGDLNTVELTLKKLRAESDKQRRKNIAAIETAEELRDTLRLRLDRRLGGNFARLLALLQGVQPEGTVTPAWLDSFKLRDGFVEAEARAKKRALVEGLVFEDVLTILEALREKYGPEFKGIVGSWPGKPTVVKKFVESFDSAS